MTSSLAAGDWRRRLADIQSGWIWAVLAWWVVVLAWGDQLPIQCFDHYWSHAANQGLKLLSDGSLWIGYLAMLAVLVRGYALGDLAMRAYAWSYFATQMIISGGVVQLLKMTIGRARPGLEDLNGALHPDLLVASPNFHSFPSGHTTDLMISAVFIAGLLPRPEQRRCCLIIAAGLVALRVLLVKHWPTDVLAGVVLGGGGALLVIGLVIGAATDVAR
ncbi:MAG: phosphatase PAP2 family protein, partial [Xanthomonadales bacterium]|nr:phosphatase PAP2 family protein [Xanthomonadales bacterium]